MRYILIALAFLLPGYAVPVKAEAVCVQWERTKYDVENALRNSPIFRTHGRSENKRMANRLKYLLPIYQKQVSRRELDKMKDEMIPFSVRADLGHAFHDNEQLREYAREFLAKRIADLFMYVDVSLFDTDAKDVAEILIPSTL
jgi:hypothetical protein